MYQEETKKKMRNNSLLTRRGRRGRGGLTLRELEILRHLSHGQSTQEVASQLGITVRTVNFHVGHCKKKLGAENRLHAVVLAMRQNYIP